MESKQIASVRIPVELHSPTSRLAGTDAFDGEYEVPYFGHHLEILDIGANIGAFALWANLRWPQSRIHCYEPHPGTFEYLKSNVGTLDNVSLTNAAVYPEPMRLFARSSGDGEAALDAYARRMFEDLDGHRPLDVRTIHPGELPPADIIKIDVEGAEFEILRNMADVPRASLILIEYHYDETRQQIVKLLDPEFDLVNERRTAWSWLLNEGFGYHSGLAGDNFGTFFFVNKKLERMTRNSAPPSFGSISLRELVRILPAAILRSARGRLNKIKARMVRK